MVKVNCSRIGKKYNFYSSQQAIVDAVLAIRQPDHEIDLHMVEIMEMMHKSDADTKYVYLNFAFQFWENFAAL